jgi:transcriptional regulator with XRE-family HTH domain
MEMLKKIRELRKNKGFSQKNMAEKLNLSISGYAKIESGENFLSVDRMLEICRILDVTSYNHILPAVNIVSAEKIEIVIGSGVQSLENIHRNALYASKLIGDLCDTIKDHAKLNNEKIISELDIVKDILELIGKESRKHSQSYREVKGFIENID